MILKTILLLLVVIAAAMLLMFLVFILIPSIQGIEDITEDYVVSERESKFLPEIKNEDSASFNRALVLCNCDKSFKMNRAVYNKNFTCAVVHAQKGTGTDCKYACIGLGDCVKSCPQGAIYIKNKTARISSACIGCGKCADVCPQKIIKLVSKETKEAVVCALADEGGLSKNSITTCSAKNKIEKIVWIDKKDFKIWSYCYKILKSLVKN